MRKHEAQDRHEVYGLATYETKNFSPLLPLLKRGLLQSNQLLTRVKQPACRQLSRTWVMERIRVAREESLWSA